MGSSHSLEDKYTAESGSVFMSGTQALVRLPMVQMRRDQQAGLKTASFISGYRGSPLGIFDQQLVLAGKHLQAHDITFQPGVNEDLAATAIWGTQQVPLHKDATRDGVLGIWYGKGPGVDRSGDVFRHANAAGSSKHGGVLCLAGDDHAAKSSTVPHQSDHAFMSARIPMLYPSSIHEFIETGLLGIAMSRYAGCWSALKVISDTIETSAVVELGDEYRDFVIPGDHVLPEDGLNIRWPDAIMTQDYRTQELKEAAVHAFARANGIDKVVINSRNARFGIAASGKAYEDTRQALRLLGIDDKVAEDIGLRLYKVRMTWPLEPQGIREFADGLEEILVIEERREMIEHQLKQHLFNAPGATRPRIVGKRDENDERLLPSSQVMSVAVCAKAIADRLMALSLESSLSAQLQERLASISARVERKSNHVVPIERTPWFCSGCPHNSSTKVPEGSKALAGIGCHFMALWMDRNTETFTQMGAEGMPWTAVSHYVEDKHRFVNIGDGTYFHSGLLAIRAAVASGVNVTYKVLFNDAVAMTGGQPFDGELTPGRITRQLAAEGVSPIFLVSDEPELYGGKALAPGTTVRHRNDMDAVMRELRELRGCNAIVYAQTCAAEKRRRRKRGLMHDPDKRMFINADVCEGCGDCSVQSNCVSVEPLETAFGRKRRINQSSCNKDYSCANGFCPSFVTVTGASLFKHSARQIDPGLSLPAPAVPALGESSWNILITGVGGTGVLTIGSIIGMAAHIDGNASMVLDMTGLAQKGGAVVSHVKLATDQSLVASAHIVPGGADVLIAADGVVAASKDSAELLDIDRTRAVVNTRSAPVANFVLARDFDFSHDTVAQSIRQQVNDADHFHAFATIAEKLTGDAIATNILMIGYAWQAGLLPLTREAIEQAITLNGVAVDANLAAFLWGRRLAADPQAVQSLVNEVVPNTTTAETATGDVQTNALSAGARRSRPLDELTIDELVEHREAHLLQYQNRKLAKRYRDAVARMQTKTQELGLSDELVRTVAHNYARVLSYKDEYEVARLFSLPSFEQQLQSQFTGDYRIELNLAPPILSRKNSNGRPIKRSFGPWVLKLMRVLRHGKRLRGTALDIFGYTEERRAERQLITDYEADMAKLLDTLSARSNKKIAVEIMSLPDQARGFGPVKMEAMKKVAATRSSLWKQINALPNVSIDVAA